jgi:membrane-associated phospholipid phosphatase
MKVLAGLCCLLAVVAIGLAVGRGPAPAKLDDAVRRHLHGWLEQRSYRGLVAKVAAERRDGHGTYVTAALPLLVAAAVAATGAARGRRPPLRAWLPWLLVLLLTVPLAWALRVAIGRPGPDEGPVAAWSQGAYPSGGALLVALGWIIGGAVTAWLRPSWRLPIVGLAVLALAVHLVARVAVGDHWLTDVVGSYLLAAGVALLADRLRPG